MRHTELFSFQHTVGTSPATIIVPVDGRRRLVLTLQNNGVALNTLQLSLQGHHDGHWVRFASTAAHYTSPVTPLTACVDDTNTPLDATTLGATTRAHLYFDFEQRCARLLRLQASVASGQTNLTVLGFFAADF